MSMMDVLCFQGRGIAVTSRFAGPTVDSRCPSNCRDRIGRSRCAAEHCRAVRRCSPAHRGDRAVDPTRSAVVAPPRRGSDGRKYLGVSPNRPDVRGYTKRAPEVSPRTSTATSSRRNHEVAHARVLEPGPAARGAVSNHGVSARHCFRKCCGQRVSWQSRTRPDSLE